MKPQSSVVIPIIGLCLVVLVGCAAVVVGGATIGEKCSNDFEKVTTCLSYATGKAATPSKDCCTSVSEIKDDDPVCLCYIIQQTHDGGEQVKSLGIQESRLLQLPSACKLSNASATDCPKLLNIPASSPDYKIFMNSSASSATPSTSTTPSAVTGTSLPTPTKASESSGSIHGPQLPQLVSIALVILFGVFQLDQVALTLYTRG